MTRSGIAAVALAGAFACVSAAGGSASATAPALTARSFAPFSVRGAHFEPREHVRVTLESPTANTVQIRATDAGTFVAVFPRVTVERCNGFVVRAAGAKGSHALLRPRPLMCASTNPG
jgi:hypothetical protein